MGSNPILSATLFCPAAQRVGAKSRFCEQNSKFKFQNQGILHCKRSMRAAVRRKTVHGACTTTGAVILLWLIAECGSRSRPMIEQRRFLASLFDLHPFLRAF
jgi:hypothetical protein